MSMTSSTDRSAKSSKSDFLVQTRLAGQRMRERALQEFAAEAARKNWSIMKCRVEASARAIDVAVARNLTSRKALATMSGELQLAGHPDVRNDFERLMHLRDEVWTAHTEFLRDKLHGPSQVLVDMMRRQKRSDERRHVSTSRAYVAYLRKRFGP